MSVFWKCFYLSEDALVGTIAIRMVAWGTLGLWRDHARRKGANR
jgi:hypothetical protein